MAAQRGRERECRELATIAMQRSVVAGLGWATDQARLAWAELELGLGNAREALEHFDQLDPVPLPPVLHLAAADVIDAALRVGDSERARSALEAFAAWAPSATRPWSRRCSPAAGRSSPKTPVSRAGCSRRPFATVRRSSSAPARSSPTVSGCAVGGSGARHGYSCATRSMRSRASAPPPGPSGLAASCRPRARPRASATCPRWTT
jgi:hypothetical protein